MSFRFKVAPRADRQIRDAAQWWTVNRTAAPDLVPALRRILLSGTQYHLYYNVLIDERVVEVLALWHTSRRDRPRL